MPIDELDFARENLRRQVVSWITEVMPEGLKGIEQLPEDDHERRVLIDTMLVISFPIEEYCAYRDLVRTRMEAIQPQ
jgi:hypothetical protein